MVLAAPRDPKYFSGDRIICRQVLSDYLNCTYLKDDFIIDQSVFIAKLETEHLERINPYFLLGQLCSKLVAFYFKFKANEFDALFPKIKIGEFRELPVNLIDIVEQEKIALNVEALMNKHSTLNTQVLNFLTFFTKQYQIEKLTKKFQNWHELDFGDFIKELNKAIKSTNKTRAAEDLAAIPALTKKDEFEWMELFEENKKKAVELQTQIETTEKEIDQMVYELYGLSEEEIRIVENS